MSWQGQINQPIGVVGVDSDGKIHALDASQLYNLNASNISTGNISVARLPNGGVNGASQLVQLDVSGNLPALDAASLTNLTAANITGNIPTTSLSKATTSGFGVVQIGSNIDVAAGVISVATAGATSGSAGTLGVAAGDGVTITVNGSGIFSAVATSNINGGSANALVYQSAANTTAFIASANGVLVGDAGTPTYTTTPTLTGTNFSGIPNSATTAVSANTASAIVARDVNGDFSAGTITANLTGTASGNQVLKPLAVNGNFATWDAAGQTVDNGISLNTSTSLAGAANTNVPSTLAIKTYVDNAVTGSLNILGTWDAATNTPTLTAGIGVRGNAYICNVAGTQTLPSGSPVTYAVGDLLFYSSSNIWDVVPAGNTVVSVNGQQGIVSLGLADMDDTTITGPAVAQLLVYNGTASKWENVGVTGVIAITEAGVTSFANTITIAQGGTSATTQQAAINNLAGAVTSGAYLRGDGTNVSMSMIQAADIPILNQSTTGNAATATMATNLSGTSVNSIPYQSASATTSYISSANDAVLVTNGSGAPSFATTLPAVDGSALTNLTATNIVGTISNSATTATSSNTSSAIVARDASGDFAAHNITVSGSLVGNASNYNAFAPTAITSSSTLTTDISMLIATGAGGYTTTLPNSNTFPAWQLGKAIYYVNNSSSANFIVNNVGGLNNHITLSITGATTTPPLYALDAISLPTVVNGTIAGNLFTATANAASAQSFDYVATSPVTAIIPKVQFTNGNVLTIDPSSTVGNIKFNYSVNNTIQVGSKVQVDVAGAVSEITVAAGSQSGAGPYQFTMTSPSIAVPTWAALGGQQLQYSVSATSTPSFTGLLLPPLPSTYRGNSSASWNGSLWVITDVTVGSKKVFTSPDAITWTLQTLPRTYGGYSSASWNGSLWVITANIANTTKIFVSADSINWSYTGEPSVYVYSRVNDNITIEYDVPTISAFNHVQLKASSLNSGDVLSQIGADLYTAISIPSGGKYALIPTATYGWQSFQFTT